MNAVGLQKRYKLEIVQFDLIMVWNTDLFKKSHVKRVKLNKFHELRALSEIWRYDFAQIE